jgi:RNA polymerase sigma-70 factor (ECF subfamily)
MAPVTSTPETLFIRFHDRLLRYFSRVAGEPEIARDLTQEVFLRVSRSTVPAVSDGQVAGWMFKIARNVALDHHRLRRRKPEAELASAPEVSVGPDQPLAVVLRQALGTLSDLDRDVFLLREVSGLTRDEIAAACDLTPDAVRSRIHRARLELRAALAAPLDSLKHERIRISDQTGTRR